jgi:signal peptide peptidase SppA
MPHVAARLFNTPLMVDGAKAVAVVNGLGSRLFDGELVIEGPAPADHVAFSNGRPSMRRLGDPLGRRLDEAGYGDRILDMIEGVAVIGVEGTLVHKGKWIGAFSGETSYEGLQTQVARARRDERVRAVVFEVDSYGGEVAGAFDTAELIYELSQEKPTLAILTDYALSGAYLLASATRAIVMPDTGYAGSIGIVTMHVDFSRALENDGIRVTVISSGARKADGSPFRALPADVIARLQDDLDRGRDLFAETVARYRGRRLSKKAALSTEAATYRGEAAVEAGLADGVVRPTIAFDAFVDEVNRL